MFRGSDEGLILPVFYGSRVGDLMCYQACQTVYIASLPRFRMRSTRILSRGFKRVVGLGMI